MALQLRRGLNSERTGETFAAGELVYTTDTKQLYVGDGTTTGGILVSNSVASSPSQLTQNLNLNGFNISGTGNITATAFVGDGSGLTNLPNTGGSGTGVVDGQEYAIDIQGSVRGDDTTIIVDSVLGRVSADFYGDGSNITNITLDQLSGVDTTGVTTDSILKYDGANWVIGTDNNSGGGTGVIQGQTYDINISGDIVADDSTILVNTATQQITAPSGFTGNLAGDVTGNVTGAVTGNLTGTVFGDVIGDVTGNLKGNLFFEDSSLLINSVSGEITATGGLTYTGGSMNVTSETPGQSTFGLFNTGGSQVLKISRTDTGTAPSQIIGSLAFDQIDDGGTTTYNSIGFWHGGIYIANSSTGTFAASNYIGIEDGNLCVGDYSAAAGKRLDVRGNAVVSGNLEVGALLLSGSNIDTSDSSAITVTPAVTLSSDLSVENHLTVTGSVTADKFISTGTETPEISASANLNLTAGNAVVVTNSPLRMASFTTTERNALAAQNGDIIYNTTDNKFQGYENGAWANLI